jgi:hypothetical protein
MIASFRRALGKQGERNFKLWGDRMISAFRGHLVGDALVAIDARSLLTPCDYVYFRRDRVLFIRIHAVEAMAIAAFA